MVLCLCGEVSDGCDSSAGLWFDQIFLFIDFFSSLLLTCVTCHGSDCFIDELINAAARPLIRLTRCCVTVQGMDVKVQTFVYSVDEQIFIF